MKVSAVAALKASFPLGPLLDVAGLARSTYYYHQKLLHRRDPHADLKQAMRVTFLEAYGRYGYRRMCTHLQADGWCVGKKLVRKLMRELGLVCQVRRRKRYSSYQGEVGKIAPNELNRDFTATAPNQKWVTDITEFRLGERKLYLSPIMDLFDRQIIAYSIGDAPTVRFTLTALEDALALVPRGITPLVHSDQGSQYQHLSWQRTLSSVGAIPSMSRKGNCLDNAVIESFFGHLKAEFFHQKKHSCRDAFINELNQYITWYNTKRISTRLGGLSPVQYRTQALAA